MTDWPIAVRSIDIARPLSPITGIDRYPRVRIFVSRGERLLGAMDVWTHGAAAISLDRLREAIADRFAHDLSKEHVQRLLGADIDDSGAARSAASSPAPMTVSIIVPTCDRPDDLRRCLASLTTQQTRHAVEVIVVDNRPASGIVRQITAAFPNVRVVEEPRPGLSFARNAGIAHASGEIIVATDDDVMAPHDWIEKLLEPFARSEVMCVTGNVLPLELETEAQCRFEAYGGLGKGFARFEVTPDWFRTRRVAVPTWLLGATANAAFRASAFTHPQIGLLDEALGAGTPTGCSEDTYLFYRILKAGYCIVYEPSAYVWHRHRSTMASLRHQIYAYSKGHVAYQLTTWMREGDRRALVRLFYSLPKIYARRGWQRLCRHSDYPLSLILLEMRGNLGGPLALWRSRRRVRRLGASAPLTESTPAPLAGGRHTLVPERSHAVSLESQITEGPAA